MAVSGGSGYTSATASDYVVAVTPLGGSSANYTLSSAPSLSSGALTGTLSGSIAALYSQVPIVTISGGGTAATTAATTAVNAGSAVSLASSANLTTSAAIFGSAVSLTGANVTNTGGTITTGALTANATVGDLTVGTVTNAASINLAAVGNVTQFSTSTLTGLANGSLTVAGNNVTLTNSNVLANSKLALSGGNVSVTSVNGSGVRLTNSAVRGDLRVNSTGPILFGTGSGTLSETVTVGGNLIANTTGTSISSITVTNNANATSLTGTRFSGNLANATVSFTGGGGTGATGNPVFDANGRLSSISITNAGSGYTSKPTVTIAGVTGSNIGSAAAALTSNVTGATITDDVDVTMIIAGAMSLNTKGGNVVIQSTVGSGRGYGQLGQINANTAGLETAPANVTVQEKTTIGVGNVTANVLTLNSTTGNIIFQPTNIPTIATNTSAITTISARASSTNATITQTSNVTTTSGNSVFNTSGGTILDNSSNSFGGLIQVINGANNVFVTNSTFTLQNATTVTGSNKLAITTVNGDAATAQTRTITVNAGANATNVTLTSIGDVVLSNATFANLTVSAANNKAVATAISASANVTVNNTLTVSAVTGNIEFLATKNASLSTVIIGETPGTTTIASVGNLTIRGTTSGAVSATAGNNATYAGVYGVAFGNLTAGSLTVEAKNGTNNTATDGISGDITQQTGTSLAVFGTLSATVFGGNVTLANSGNNFGQISASTGTPLSGAITIAERDTQKIGNISTSGAVSLTSAFGGIIEDPNANILINAASVTATAPNGSILLGGTAKTTGNTTGGNIQAATLSASGAAAIASSGNLVLNASSANSLTAIAGDTLTQSAALNVFGLASFKAANGIALNDAANNFGPVSLEITALNKNVSITEASTLNLRKVNFSGTGSGNGTFTATSLRGDIIDSGLGGVVLGGRVGNIGSGVVTLTAANGNITIDDPTSDIATLSGSVFNAKNVTLAVLGTTDLVLGAANITTTIPGNLTATSATGHIVNAGNLVIGGQASFQTGVGNITLSQAGNQFGSIRFAGNAVAISQSNDMKIVTGSSAIKPAQFSSGGNISIVNNGGVVAFADTATLSAVGSITLPKLVQAAGTITVNASGTKDLSALSLSGDLASKTPANYGTGTYVPPTP